MMTRFRTALLLAASSVAVLTLPGCGGSSGPSTPDPTPIPTPVPTPAPSPTPSQPAACRLTAPTIDCSTRTVRPLEMADTLQAAVDVAVGTPGAMYSEFPNRIYDLDLFRSRTLEHLTAAGLCGAWDYGNEVGDEIFVRSADGCVTEQYDLITGEGGVRNANKGSNGWQEGWGVPVPGPKPQFSREGDASCSLPGDRSTFCFGIKGTQGEFGADVYKLLVAVMNENPQLFDPQDFVAGQPDFIPEQLRVAAWRINDQDAYIAAVEKKLRANGFCAYVEKGDILKVKKVSRGNIFHEEMDIVQDPASGGSYVSFVVKDRCHNAGF
ncbi:MAG TPA: hypothetical protein VLF95_11465 [Vicinamibacteria bacterium]|nr:hypothetical protein [Vicinamibacteria bacterium]